MNFDNQWLLDDYELQAPTPPAPATRKVSRMVNEAIQVVMLAFLFYLALNVIVPRYEVEGSSMEPSFYSTQRVLVSRLHYVIGDPQRGDVIVFERDENLIKRVIGLPGETIRLQDGHVYINDIELNEDYISAFCETGTCRDSSWTLGADEYFVLGDNRPYSNDSHNFGPIHRDQIVGKVVFQYWPLDHVYDFGA